MEIEQYVKQRKKRPCNQPIRKKSLADLHSRIGELLSVEVDERSKMEVQKPELMLPSAADQGFIF